MSVSSEILIVFAEYFRNMQTPPDIDMSADVLADTTIQHLNFDSLKSLEFLMHVEETLGAESPIEQHPDDTTLGELAAHYEALVRETSKSMAD